MKLSRTISTISDYTWYYLYYIPRYRLDKRYRERLKTIEELLRKARQQAKKERKK